MNKICNDCGKEKSIDLFYKRKNSSGVSAYCKPCIKIRNQKIRESRQEETSIYQKEYQAANKERLSKIVKNYAQKNKIKIRKWNREYRKERYRLDPVYRIKQILRSLVKRSVKISGQKRSIENVLGCSIEFFKIHMEGKFKEGMSWSNHGFNGWHIDHIVPLASSNSKEEALSLCHYSNLQPLWAKDNFQKGSSIPKI